MPKYDYESIIDNFLLVINKIKPAGNRLFSLALPIEIKNRLSIIDKADSQNLDYILFSLPYEKKTFIGIDSLWELKKNNLSLGSKRQIIQSIVKEKITNFDLLSLHGIPLIFSTKKFNDSKEKDIWQNFDNENFVIPRFLFCFSDVGSFIILNFFKSKISASLIYSSFYYLLNFLSLITKPKTNALIKRIHKQSEYKKWKKQVEELLDLINKKKFQKIVLSRKVKYRLTTEICLSEILNKLESRFPETTIYMIKRKNSIFFGATPELLLKLDNKKIFTEALAGSAPRGKSYKEDKIYESDLLISSKNREEQKIVTDYILNSILKFTTNIHFNKIPEIKKLSNIQHLNTKISAAIKNNVTVFDLINTIYPTPAICGIPAKKAKRKIHEIEEYNRGLYSGVVGWIDENLDGSFYVAIRSALINNNYLYVFAGCGIVTGSDPKLEYEETELKLNSILSLFKYEKKN